MKKILLISLLFIFFANSTKGFAQNNDESKVNLVLDNWHKAAAEANFANYFAALTADAVFIGTDPNENWNKTEFQAFSKPYFDKGQAWSFTPLQRHIYFDKSGKIAWFDELLDTWMKICRGSGVLEKIDGEWKIKQYVLSMTIPNDNTAAVIKIIAPTEDSIIKTFQEKK